MNWNFIKSGILFVLFAFHLNAQDQLQSNWNEFEAKYGPTLELWNEKTQKPHRVISSGLRLSTKGISDKIEAQHLVMDFLAENKNLYNIDPKDLILSSSIFANNTFYLNYVQRHEAIPLLHSEIVFRIHKNGMLSVFGLDYYENISSATPVPKLDKHQLKSMANSAYSEFGSHVEIEVDPSPYYLPFHASNGYELRAVVLAFANNFPHFRERFFMDLNTGEIYERENILCQAVDGDVDASILPILATDLPTDRPLANMNVFINGSAVVTDSLGHYNHPFNGPGTSNLVARLKGPYINVKRFAGADAQFTKSVSDGQNVAIYFSDSNSTMGERNVFYHSNIAHDYIKRVDTGFSNADQTISCTVEDNSATCNAYWTGSQIFYNTGSGGCINSAHSASTIYHEYGHALNDLLYQQAGVPQGMQSLTLHEAMADVTSCMMLDENRFALGFFGIGQFTRNLQNSNFYPTSLVGQQHTDGLILAGSFWDLRLNTDPETAYRLAHFAKYGTPDDPDLGIAFAEYFIETLIADDDDGNLANGSPHFNEIISAFCKHGIGLNLFMASEFNHTEVANQSIPNNAVKVEVNYNVPSSFHNAIQNLELRYTTDNFGSTLNLPLSNNANGLEAFIPGQPEGTVVKYFFAYQDSSCQSQAFSPSANFQQFNYSYWVGDYQPIFFDNFETNKGWAISGTATSGNWQRATPELVIDDVGKISQPGDDFSSTGSQCFVTGAAKGALWYSNDVDNGNTIIKSPVLSAKAVNQTLFQFRQWFTHGAGTILPANGSMRIQVTNNGQTWTDVEILGESTKRDWRKVLFKVDEFKTPNDSLQFRIIVNDPAPGTIVEALVDDFEVLELNQVVGLKENDLRSVMVYPNPVSSTVHFGFPNQQSGEIRVFDLSGKMVWSLGFEKKESIKWNVNSSSLNPGLYSYSIQIKDNNIQGKLIVQ